MDRPQYMNWIVREDGVVFEDQQPLNCYRLSYEINDNILDDWALHLNVLYVQENPDIPRELTEGTRRLVEIENPHNSAVIGEIDTRMFYSRIPILWWPIGDDICKNIYFRRVSVSTVFNPAKLIQRFVDEGFTVVGSGDIQKIKFEKAYGNRRLQFQNFGSLCDLISHSLMKTEDVFLSSKEIICACERGDIPVNSKVDMHIQLHNFGEQITDEEE